ncbi:MAG: hypothetical protein IJ737_07280 [Ruminococcus sp.]|nr:hypothetical protein [Ruminococcus sp.]
MKKIILIVSLFTIVSLITTACAKTGEKTKDTAATEASSSERPLPSAVVFSMDTQPFFRGYSFTREDNEEFVRRADEFYYEIKESGKGIAVDDMPSREEIHKNYAPGGWYYFDFSDGRELHFEDGYCYIGTQYYRESDFDEPLKELLELAFELSVYEPEPFDSEEAD